MKIYLLWHRDYRDYYDHPQTLCGVFDTEEKARGEIPNQIALGLPDKKDDDAYFEVETAELNLPIPR